MFNRRSFFGRLLGLAAAPVAVEQVLKEEVVVKAAEPMKVLPSYNFASGYGGGYLVSGECHFLSGACMIRSGEMGIIQWSPRRDRSSGEVGW